MKIQSILSIDGHRLMTSLLLMGYGEKTTSFGMKKNKSPKSNLIEGAVRIGVVKISSPVFRL